MIFNFRIDKEMSGAIAERIAKLGELSQGWGGGMDAGLDIRNDDFVQKCVSYYGMKTTRVPSNLTRIREFKDDDILVSPHVPSYGLVTITVVKGDFPLCYRYEANDGSHQNHRIAIKEHYGTDGSISMYNHVLANYRGKLRWRRLPVLAITQYESIFNQVIARFKADPSTQLLASELDEYIENQKQELINLLKKSLREITPSGRGISFERICEYILERNGYRVARRNQYSGTGGDIDLLCQRDMSALPFESGEFRLLVQVKKHEGDTDEQAVNQLLEMMNTGVNGSGCVMSLGDDYSQEARVLGEKHAIALMNGDEICEHLIKAMIE